MQRAQRVVGYLSKLKFGTIRIRTGEPDFTDLPEVTYDWAYSVYGDVEEEIPYDIPEPLGNYVVFTTYVDANLHHDVITGRSVTGVLHFINQMPFEWCSKKQGTVETATYGSEFVAARTATEQILQHRLDIRYLGVPIKCKTYMFGDNESTVNSGSQPHAKLTKRHSALSFHRVREAVAAGVLSFNWINGKFNPADILSKHWGYQMVWDLLQPILFWEGDTMEILTKAEKRALS